MSLIEDLQAKILAGNTPTSEVLKTAIIIGHNENIQTLIDWATLELNGYLKQTTDIPSYRNVFLNYQTKRYIGDNLIDKDQEDMKDNILLGIIDIENRISNNDFFLKQNQPDWTSIVTNVESIQTDRESLKSILYQIQQETLTRITKVKKEMKENQKQSVIIHNKFDMQGTNATAQGGGYQSTNTVNNYVTNEQKIDLQNQLNQLQELIKEYQKNSDYEYVKGEISHIQKQLEYPPIEHKKIVGLWQYIPNLITGLSSGTASATAIQLISYISQSLGC